MNSTIAQVTRPASVRREGEHTRDSPGYSSAKSVISDIGAVFVLLEGDPNVCLA